MAKKEEGLLTKANPPRVPVTEGTKEDPERLDTCGPRGCKIKAPTGRYRVEEQPEWFDFGYTTEAAPCPDRTTCPIQLFFKDGKPHLRFCRLWPKKKTFTANKVANGKLKKVKRGKGEYVEGRRPGDPGYVVAVKDAAEAQKIALAACRCWSAAPDGRYETITRYKKERKTGRVFTENEKVWRGSFEKCVSKIQKAAGRKVRLEELPKKERRRLKKRPKRAQPPKPKKGVSGPKRRRKKNPPPRPHVASPSRYREGARRWLSEL